MSNLKKLVVVMILILLALAAIMVIRTRIKTQEPILPAISETKSNSQGEVVVEVTPEKLGPNEKENIFEVNLNTHSVDLTFDFAKIMVLVDDLGNQYQAIRWEGERGGHHLAGKIIFPKINNQAQKAVLKISQIGGVEKTFNWNL